MVEIAELYGFVIETDMAMLMAADHFGQIAANSPQSNHQFIRNREVRLGVWGLPYQYARTAKQLDESYSISGRNRVLRNRSVILFLFELWERKYRSKLAVYSGFERDIQSDLFGDLRIYRNCISHNGGVLDTEVKVLRFVERGCEIDLIFMMDKLFELVLVELNRLALVYFNVTTRFSFDNVAPGIVVAGGKSWRSDHAIQPPSPQSED